MQTRRGCFRLIQINGKGRSPENHYQCMNFKDICKLPVDMIADKDSVLLMWTTDPFLEKAMTVIKSWRFYI